MKIEMEVELLQPWSTFVMKTQLPPPILEKMTKISDEIVKNEENKLSVDSPYLGAGQIENQFFLDLKILEREQVLEFFLGVCKNYVIQAFCQSSPFNKEETLKEEWMTQLTGMHVNSQKDNEYFPVHSHTQSAITAVMYLKIPEYLPSRQRYGGGEKDGAIEFSNNSSQDKIWGGPTLQIHPKVGDFLMFSSSQQHLVYPFRTADGKGERRSISFNAQFTSKSAQDFIKKQQDYQETI